MVRPGCCALPIPTGSSTFPAAVQRLERIRRNKAMLRQLGVADAAGGLASAVAAEQAAVQAASGPVRRAPSRPHERRPPAPVAAVPVRKSARQRGDRPLTQDEAVAAAAAELNEAAAGVAGDTDLGEFKFQRACLQGWRRMAWICMALHLPGPAVCCSPLNSLVYAMLPMIDCRMQSMLACWTWKLTSS